MKIYPQASTMMWNDLLSDGVPDFTPPITAHLPIHPPHSRDFVHVEPSLTVVRRRIHPDMSVRDQDHVNSVISKNPQLYIQFALGDPPFIPDFHFTRMSLADKAFPHARAEFWAHDIAYRFDYVCAPVDADQSMIAIRVTARYEGEGRRLVTIWAKPTIQPEFDIDIYHYRPYQWDTRQWRPSRGIAYSSPFIRGRTGRFARISSGDFTTRWIDKARFPNADYQSLNKWTQPYHVDSAYQLATIDHALRMTRRMTTGQSASCELLVLVNHDRITPEHLHNLATADFMDCARKARRHFQRSMPRQAVKLTFPSYDWERIFTETQQSTLQLLVDFHTDGTLMPTQGGSSERYYVWVWEALCMLEPMLTLGHTAPVRRALEFIFKLQDGGCPPQGKFTSLAGAIGTTGPRWISSTGAALALAAAYCRHTRDAAFIRRYLPRMIRAADWIIGEIRATRRDPDRNPLTRGLMPFGHATDGDIGFVYAFTDAYSYYGLAATTRFLAEQGHPRAAEFKRECDLYRIAIQRTTASLARPNGWIERRVPVPEESVTLKFETLIGPTPLAHVGLLDLNSRIFLKFKRYQEECLASDSFMGNMDQEVAYLGFAEQFWHTIYLRRGEWKKAFLVLQTNMRYGMAPDTFQVLERFSRTNPAFVPWQPNGSGNGRMLEMMIKSICFQDGDTATLLGCIPFAWLRRNRTTALRNLCIPGGKLSLTAVMGRDNTCRLTLQASNAVVMPAQIRIPTHLGATAVSGPLRRINPEIFRVTRRCQKVVFTLTDAECRINATPPHRALALAGIP